MSSDAYKAGVAAYRERLAFEANPHASGGPDEVARCRVREWPEVAQQWHRGWVGEATRQAEEADAKLARKRAQYPQPA